MISYEEALAIIAGNVGAMSVETRPLHEILGYVLAEPVVATFDLPLFDNSAVDGFGVKLGDVATATELQPSTVALLDVIRAGDGRQCDLTAGHALKILTGAPVPAGVDAVVMKEYCRESDGRVSISTGASAGANIRRSGEEYRQGQEILVAGAVATPPVIGLLATLGHGQFPVYAKPRAAVISTGDELVQPGQKLEYGQIYDSNSVALLAALAGCGVSQGQRFHAAEDLQATQNVLSQALACSDIVITAGGVSVGDFDFVKTACENLGVKTLIWRISIKPGKPVYFGVLEEAGRRKYVFGLPGNPVSALVTFHEFVRPALNLMQGNSAGMLGKPIPARLTKSVYKKAGRSEFVRARWSVAEDEIFVEPTTGQESHMLGGLCRANALIVFPRDCEELKQGELVQFHLINW